MPDGDYLEFGTVEEVEAVLARPDFDEFAEAMGARFRQRLLEQYGPERFWRRLMM